MSEPTQIQTQDRALEALKTAEKRLETARKSLVLSEAAEAQAREKLETLESARQGVIAGIADGQSDLAKLKRADAEVAEARKSLDSAEQMRRVVGQAVGLAARSVYEAEQAARAEWQTAWSDRREPLLAEGVKIAAAALRPAWQAQDLGGVGMGAERFVDWIARDLAAAILAAPAAPVGLPPLDPHRSPLLTDEERRAAEDAIRADRLAA